MGWLEITERPVGTHKKTHTERSELDIQRKQLVAAFRPFGRWCRDQTAAPTRAAPFAGSWWVSAAVAPRCTCSVPLCVNSNISTDGNDTDRQGSSLLTWKRANPPRFRCPVCKVPDAAAGATSLQALYNPAPPISCVRRS
jgi:hypothetical protein